MLLALVAIVLVLFVVLPLIGMTLWALVSVAFVGLIIGGLARLILPGRQNIGVGWTILLGWLGSLVGGFLGDQVIDTNHFLTVLIEIAVAAAFIAIYSGASNRQLSGPRPRALR